METEYIFELDVVRTTRESGYAGGKDVLTKSFFSFSALAGWAGLWAGGEEHGDEINKWIDDNNFPNILEVGEYRCYRVEKTQIDPLADEFTPCVLLDSEKPRKFSKKIEVVNGFAVLEYDPELYHDGTAVAFCYNDDGVVVGLPESVSKGRVVFHCFTPEYEGKMVDAVVVM